MESKKSKWSIDNTHSEVQFKVKHLVISTVTGQFNSFEGTLHSNDQGEFDGAQVNFKLDVNSIDTNVNDRDAHLKSADFFDADKYPHITFTGSLHHKTDESYSLKGNFKIKEVEKEILLDVNYGGTMVDGYGQTKAGFEITGKINRKEFGLTWNMVTEAGGVVVGEDVRIILNVQIIKN